MSQPDGTPPPREEHAPSAEARDEARPDPTPGTEQSEAVVQSEESPSPEEAARAEESARDGALAEAVTPPRQPLPQQRVHPQTSAPSGYYQHPARPQPPRAYVNPRWHRPGLSARQVTVLLVFAVALFAAWSAFPGDGVGIGLALSGITMVAVPLSAVPARELWTRLPGAVIVAALWSVAAIRDADWVVALCAVTAFLLTPLVLAPQRRISGTILVAVGWLEGIPDSFGWAKRGRPARDGKRPGTMRAVWTAAVTVLLLLVFGGLFAAADSTFADLIARLLPDLNAVEVILRLMLAAVLVPIVLVWTYTAVAKPSFDSEGETGGHRVLSRFEVAVPLGALNLLFAAFVAVQLRVYFGGEAYVMDTAGLTFAEYARTGFWQLSVVAVLALLVIGIAAWFAPKRARADRWTVRVLLGPLALMSTAVVVSAVYRMYTYTETYGLTRLRIWIFTVEFWLAILFALVLVCCWKLRATWLPQAVIASGALTLLGLAAANPDALIARFNISHEHQLDLQYLSELSADAMPELTELSDQDLGCMVYSGTDLDDEDGDVMAWNWGRQRAADLAEDVPEPDEDACDLYYEY